MTGCRCRCAPDDDRPDVEGSNQRLVEIVARLSARVEQLETANRTLEADRDYWQRQAGATS